MAKTSIRAWLFGFVLCSGVWSTASWADDPQLDACIVAAANYRHLDPALLKAICTQESGCNRLAVHPKNKDGSVDYGAFGINSSWLPKLKKKGITLAHLTDGSCTSAYVAAWLLADAINRFGPTWRAVGAYNSPTEANRQIYAILIQQHYTRLLANQR